MQYFLKSDKIVNIHYFNWTKQTNIQLSEFSR